MTTLARRERAALADTLVRVGPDAPTLCEGWLSRDLAAHLVLREHAPLAGSGIWLRPLSGLTDKTMAELAEQPWPTLVDQVRARPALWHPARWGGALERAFDDGEMWIHHEDLLRGDGVARPRALSADDQDALWAVLTGAAKFALRSLPVGVVAEVPGRPRTTLRRPPGKGSTREVTLRGLVGEVLLAVNGRARAAEVELLGEPDDVQALTQGHLGL